MRSPIKEIFKADLKHFSPPFMKGYIIKNLVIFTIFLLIFVPLIRRTESPVREHDPKEEMYVYDQHPHVEYIDDGDEYLDIRFEDDGPKRSIEEDGEANGPLTLGAGFLGFGIIAFLMINLFLIHAAVFTTPMKNGYGRAVTRMGVSAGALLKSKMLGVGAVFLLVSLFDILIASIIAQMIAGWFWKIFIPGSIAMISIIWIYAISFGIQALIKIPKKGHPMVPWVSFTIITGILFMITKNGSNLIMWSFDDMLGTGTTSGAGTPLMYLSPFHAIGEIIDWSIYGTEVSILSFIWVPFAAALLYLGFRSLKKLEYEGLIFIPGNPYTHY